MKEKLEKDLETKSPSLLPAANSPGTDLLDGGAIKHVDPKCRVLVPTAILDETNSRKYNCWLGGTAIVDIGGGTTGISIVKMAK